MGAINPTMANRFKKYENGGEVEQSNSTFQSSPNMVGGRDMTAMYKKFTEGKDIASSLARSNADPLKKTKDILNIAGNIPVVGNLADAANVGLSLGQGRVKEAVNSAIAGFDPTHVLGGASAIQSADSLMGTNKLQGADVSASGLASQGMNMIKNFFEEGGEVPKKDKKSLQDLVFDKHGVEYKGEIPLGLDEFPMVKDILEKGKRSNVNTRSYEWHDDDGKEHYQLDAGMHKGKILNEQEGKNLGSYNSPKERQKADDAIHEYQSMLSPYLDIRRDGQITANNVKALRAEIEKELLGN